MWKLVTAPGEKWANGLKGMSQKKMAKENIWIDHSLQSWEKCEPE